MKIKLIFWSKQYKRIHICITCVCILKSLCHNKKVHNTLLYFHEKTIPLLLIIVKEYLFK